MKFNEKMIMIPDSTFNELKSILKEISSYPKWYSSSLENGVIKQYKTSEGQLIICSDLAKDALKIIGDNE